MDVLSLLLLFAVAVVPLVPTEVVLIGMGVAAADGGRSLVPVVAVAAVGCLISDYLLYTLGRRGGARLLDRLRSRAAAEQTAQWITRHLERHGLPALVAARWLPAGGTVGSLLAGTLRWPRGRFVAASAIGVTLWCTYAGLLGYAGGTALRRSDPASTLVVLLAALACVAGVVVFRRVLAMRA
ncbi:hypothetical protein B1813_12360 [Saccharomonospora piscinae]|uniref:VTT domain-containing protein n=1 Tax=Saccharomonospora piscinae TaxID=687388 RepID=A0A1V9A7Z0_SACPI|nr:DedA family protein [Saccharomonospora piscinae]OQO93242.1 hypothetical protein B1813_12360 [Saccharomonospora piscinae]